MRLILVSKNDLTDEQRRHLEERLRAPEHRHDYGPTQVWNTDEPFLYAFIHQELGIPIAIAEAPGRPIATPGWWVDSKFRGQGLGNELIDLLAARLKAEGVTGIGPTPMDTYLGEYDEQSTRLARRLSAHFGQA